MTAEFLIDISRLLRRAIRGRLPTGIDRVCLSYVAYFGTRAQAVLQMGGWRRILAHYESQVLFALLLDPPVNLTFRVWQVLVRASLPPWPSQQANGTFGFYLGHFHIEECGFVRWLERTGQKPVYFVHDLIPITHPEYCRVGEQAVNVKRMKVMLQTCAGLIGNSQFTLDVMADFARSQGLLMPPSVAAWLGAAKLATSDQTTALLPQPYFVMLGTIEPRKNHLLILNVWRDLVHRLGLACPHLVLIGQRGWECENVLDMLERCEVIRPFVHEKPACSDDGLAKYLTHAKALLFPSFIEGYGLPLVEALMLGTPVLASDLPVFREIAGDIPDFLSPIDGSSWVEAVLSYAALYSARRDSQLQRIKEFKVPTWSKHFLQIEKFLERLV